MENEHSEQELKDRFELIERMMAEGRQTTGNWGWAFVLWGVAYYVALAWSAWGRSEWAWPVTMLMAVIATIVINSLRSGPSTKNTLGLAIGSIWISLGISMFLLFFALGVKGKLADPHVFLATMSAMLGMANGASGLILRWKGQLVCAGLWWATAVATCFGSNAQSTRVFLAAIFLCQIAFGVYSMIPATHRQGRGPAHA